MAVVIITHHERLLEFNKPQQTHVILAGRIVENGDASLAHELHDQGYTGVRSRHPEVAAEEQQPDARPLQAAAPAVPGSR
jgi:Fe-S cluster assembly ATP-binding protein